MSRLKDAILCVCACVLIACASSALVRADIVVSIQEVPEYPGAPSLWICEWNECSTEGGVTSWIFHADEDIADLHIGTWDDDEFVTPGSTAPYFDQSSYGCTMEDPGGPPVPGVDPQPYWQTLDLWGGTGLLYCHYYEISISHVPTLDGVPQNVWVHATPEPSALLLLGLGGLVALRRR